MHRLQLEAAARGKHTPLDILLAICRKDLAVLAELDIDPNDCTTLVRKSAAESAAPYLHRRMPVDLEASFKPGALWSDFERSRLTPDEIAEFARLLAKGAGRPDRRVEAERCSG